MAVERFEDFVRFAIEQERKSVVLYEKYAHAATSSGVRRLFESLVVMEREHEAKLTTVLESASIAPLNRDEQMGDMRLADYMVEDELSDTASLDQVYVFAMKAEQQAYELYTRLASLEHEPRTKELLISLAQEELRHKRDLEREYENEFMRDN
jgi:rubrerythrin